MLPIKYRQSFKNKLDKSNFINKTFKKKNIEKYQNIAEKVKTT